MHPPATPANVAGAATSAAAMPQQIKLTGSRAGMMKERTVAAAQPVSVRVSRAAVPAMPPARAPAQDSALQAACPWAARERMAAREVKAADFILKDEMGP